METESVPVLEMDDAYTPVDGPHIAWEPRRFVSEILDVDGLQGVTPGALFYLREGRRTLAVAEAVGSRRALLDAADDAADGIAPWLPALRALADAVRLDRTAETLELHIGLLLYHWEASKDLDAPQDHYREELDRAYAYERLVRDVVPEQDQRTMRLPQAAEAHSQRLRGQATSRRVDAVIKMPDPRTATWPSLRWVGPYSREKHKDIKSRSEDVWYADLPLQLLRGWGALDTRAEWGEAERTARRDALVGWAVRWGLPKSTASEAAGVARTTIDRLLSR
ncbi:hypothetical protein [Streptomyces luteireticuli]|uniref:Uncharacterized protein n=1 Tax=Streptomyces luteireticuli TaxID=173858 RepID=A0ABP3ILH3_9ACTN